MNTKIMHATKIQAPQKKLSIKCANRILWLNTPAVMGIINTTPDSFYAESRKESLNLILTQAESMLKHGATLVDIGGYSSRPGASYVSIEEEINRIIPAIDLISKHLPELIISVDTFRADVAMRAVESGAHLINDISSGIDDPNMLHVVSSLKVPYIMMHKQGTPENMQLNPTYQHVTNDILHFFTERLALAHHHNIVDVIVDPGFGFGKTLAHNYTLLNQLSAFNIFGIPILVGLSRKKMIQTITHTDANSALNGTSVVNTLALINGANILRVHDVKEAIECINIVKAYHGDF